MKRRSFLHNGLAAAGAVAVAPVSSGLSDSAVRALAGQPFKMNYGIHDGMFKNSAGADFLDQMKYAYDLGFRAIEDNGMMDRPPAEQEKIGAQLQKLNMSMGVFVHGFDHWPVSVSMCSGSTEWREKFMKYSRLAVETSKRCGGKLVTVVPGNDARELPSDIQTANVIECLRPAADLFAKEGISMVLEPLSDTPNLFLRHSAQAYAICKAVNSPGCKILFDIYHMQRNEGDLIKGIDRSYDEISYYQIGDNPGRKEPGTGEVNYRNIFKHLHEKGYKGVLGMEHGTAGEGKEGEAALVKAYRDADNF